MGVDLDFAIEGLHLRKLFFQLFLEVSDGGISSSQKDLLEKVLFNAAVGLGDGFHQFLGQVDGWRVLSVSEKASLELGEEGLLEIDLGIIWKSHVHILHLNRLSFLLGDLEVS